MRMVVRRKAGEANGAQLDRLEALEGVTLVDRIGEEAALVEIDEGQLDRLTESLPGWSVAPERGIAHPAPPFPRGKWKLDGK